jgi:hypothetical protein
MNKPLHDILSGYGFDKRNWVIAEKTPGCWVVGHTQGGIIIHRKTFKVFKNALLWFVENVSEVNPTFL